MGKLVAFGAWEAAEFVGVIVFSRGASPQLAKSFKLPPTEICELTRVAFRRHTSPVTQAVAVAIRLLRRSNPGLRLVVSFADSAQGHTGGIYRGGNWLYLGKTAPKFEFRDRDGKVWHDRLVTKTGWTSGFAGERVCAKRSECQPIPLPFKLRFAYALDRELLPELLKRAVPYEAE